MQPHVPPSAPAAAHAAPVDPVADRRPTQGYQIIRRNGAVVAFEPAKIAVALMKAFLAVHGTQAPRRPACARRSTR